VKWLRYGFALLAIVAIVAQLRETARLGHSLVNFFSFFTIESNVIAVAALLVATRFPLLRGAATCYMTITGIVYISLLSGVDVDLTFPWVNVIVHYLMPAVVVLDWFLFPGEVRTPMATTMALWTAYPIAYLGYTFIRGAITGWYPYPFLNPSTGPGALAITVGGILVLGLALQYAIIVRAKLAYRTSV
jgi:hypothetical protein